jgi:hypothetical protein
MLKSDKVALLPKIFLLISLAFFVASLSFNSFCVEGHNWLGFGLLLLGGPSVFAGPANWPWLANPILIFAWIAILKRSREFAISASLAASALSAMFMLSNTVVGEKGPTDITCVGPGYWLWLASTVAAVISAFLVYPAILRSTTLPEQGRSND